MVDGGIEILLVEDNPNDAELTLRALRKNHIANSLIHAKDGAEALDLIFGGTGHAGPDLRNTPKVILLDLKLPKVDGTEVLRKLKGDPRTRTIPVVVMTSSQEDSDLAKCYELGVNSYIVKPVEFDAFVTVVSGLGFYWLLLNEPGR
jgi:two-component system, response regulator